MRKRRKWIGRLIFWLILLVGIGLLVKFVFLPLFDTSDELNVEAVIPYGYEPPEGDMTLENDALKLEMDPETTRFTVTDKRSGVDTTRKYEGIDLNYILTKMNSGDNGIKMTDKAARVQIKNRNRNTIAEFTVKQVEDASKTETPIIVAYGTSYQDGTNIRPFVFDNGEGADKTLGNEDGCIKLVYKDEGRTFTFFCYILKPII